MRTLRFLHGRMESGGRWPTGTSSRTRRRESACDEQRRVSCRETGGNLPVLQPNVRKCGQRASYRAQEGVEGRQRLIPSDSVRVLLLLLLLLLLPKVLLHYFRNVIIQIFR